MYSDIATDLPQDWSYCFEFTWFGPEYTNISGYNGTCADYLDNTRATDVPCAAPIVITCIKPIIDNNKMIEILQLNVFR